MRARLDRAAALGRDGHAGRHVLLLGAGAATEGQGAGQQPQRKKAPAAGRQGGPQAQPEEVKREQQPGAARVGAGRRLGAQRAVTSSFNGTEIVIFGAVDNSQQPSAESGYYDVADRGGGRAGPPGGAAQEQRGGPVAQHLVGHLRCWCPATTPSPRRGRIDEIATEEFRASHGIGFQHLRFTPAFGQAQALSTEDLKEFREAVVRLKQKQGLYVQDHYSVAFIGQQPVPRRPSSCRPT